MEDLVLIGIICNVYISGFKQQQGEKTWDLDMRIKEQEQQYRKIDLLYHVTFYFVIQVHIQECEEGD